MHLGSRVSALLDGRLPAEEEERAWSHVHECHPCRDLVEREGWIKTRLAGLSLADRVERTAPVGLKDSLLTSCPAAGRVALAPTPFVTAPTGVRHRHRSLVMIGGGAAGAAVVGALALGTVGIPQLDRGAPSDLARPSPASEPSTDQGVEQGADPGADPGSNGGTDRPASRNTGERSTPRLVRGPDDRSALGPTGTRDHVVVLRSLG